MKKLWSKDWNSSTQIRKQRKFIHKAPLNVRRQLMSTKLSTELKAEFLTKSFPTRVGDEVKILSGQFRLKTAKVVKVNLKKLRIYLEEIGVKRSDGTLSLYPIHPSNTEIIKLFRDDKLRMNKLAKIKEVNSKKNEVKK